MNESAPTFHGVGATSLVVEHDGRDEIAGSSYHGSDSPRYLRALILTQPSDPRLPAMLAYVERDTPRIVRWFRNWRWSA